VFLLTLTDSSQYVGRLAPSPTGLLHLGHAHTFLIAQQRALAAGGTLWLRDEDLDLQRARAEYAVAMREDLHWLGITWQQEMRQSDRLPAYRAAMQQLVAAGHVYKCSCSRKDLLSAMAAPHEDSDDEPVYNGRCRVAEPAHLLEENANYRFRVNEDEPVEFVDLAAGPQRFVSGCAAERSDFGDFLVWRKDGLPSYQLACVVDDAAMHVTEVVRGRDLLKSTARQLLLQRALGLTTPQYFHCDLMRDDNGIRLAKRHDALSLRTLRLSGISAAELRARLQL
jgi:glutamyl/glutaminyl-tRNA synthetase